MIPSSRRGYAMVAIAAATWGTWSLFLRPAERMQANLGAPISPGFEAAIVFGMNLVLVAPWAFADRPQTARPLRAWLGIAVLGPIDAMNSLFFFWAMQRTSIAIAVLSHYLAPLFVTALAPFALRETARRSTWLHVALAFAGLTLLLDPLSTARAAGNGSLVGAGLGATSAVFYASNVLLTKRLLPWFSTREIIGYHAVSGVLVLLFFVPHGGFSIAPAPAALLAAGSLVPGVCAGLLFMRGLAIVPASHAAVLTLLEPLAAVLVAAIVWREIPSALGALGGVLILVAAWLVTRSERRRPMEDDAQAA
jgi:drug/metabolite transporter, DME family